MGTGEGQVEVRLIVGEADDHGGVQVVDLGEQDLADRVENVQVPGLGDLGQALLRDLRQRTAVEDHDAVPVLLGQRDDDAVVSAHLLADPGILEPFGDGPGASLQRPLGEHGAEIGGAEDAGVLVEGDVLAAGAGFLHLVESLLDRPMAVGRQPGHGGDV